MKHHELILVRLVAVALLTAIGPVAQSQQSVGSFSGVETRQSEVALSPTAAPFPINHTRNLAMRSHFPIIKGSVAKAVEVTSATLQPQTPKSEALDNWLIVLAALGLIVLQLRHRHKSLLQRRITL